MIDKVQCLLAGLGLFVAFVVGYSVADSRWEREATEAKLAHETEVRSLEGKYREKERRLTETAMAAIDARDRAYADAHALRISTDRLRVERDRANRRLSAADTDSCKREREQLRRFAELASRGGDLVRRYDEALVRAIADKEFVIKVHDSQ